MTRRNMKGTAGWCALLAAVLTILSCGNPQHSTDDNNGTDAVPENRETAVPEQLAPIGDTTLAGTGLKVAVFSETALKNRHENLYLKLTHADSSPVTGADVSFSPFMDMGMMSHAAPYVQPKELAAGWYRGSVVFIMADAADMGSGWLLDVMVPGEGATDSLRFKLPVEEAAVTRTMAIDATEGRFFLSLLMPDSVPAGAHKAAFMLHGIDHDAFPATDGYTIRLETYMPDMGHGSSDNQDARGKGDGYYEGRIDLSMAGLWEIRATLHKDGRKVSADPIVFKIHSK
ncbi:FixH family protein [Parapedobacter sp. ISTM3]|uniref:FixH family protein n=1 Tax=Parapedobacter sp. ISTM3 TaxID=2800130 RepID=UPI001908C62C|nr:FixH family protein [Parapedobacter sp. ISTM3]MBK1439886.1 FixH family protein [Parapedobacter sp. ISTM3]